MRAGAPNQTRGAEEETVYLASTLVAAAGIVCAVTDQTWAQQKHYREAAPTSDRPGRGDLRQFAFGQRLYVLRLSKSEPTDMLSSPRGMMMKALLLDFAVLSFSVHIMCAE